MRWKQKNGSDAVKGPGTIQGLSLDPAPGVAEGLDLIPSARYDLILSAGLDPSEMSALKRHSRRVDFVRKWFPCKFCMIFAFWNPIFGFFYPPADQSPKNGLHRKSLYQAKL